MCVCGLCDWFVCSESHVWYVRDWFVRVCGLCVTVCMCDCVTM